MLFIYLPFSKNVKLRTAVMSQQLNIITWETALRDIPETTYCIYLKAKATIMTGD